MDSTRFNPGNAEQVLAVLQWAAGEGATLELVGGGAKRAWGRPVQAEYTLDLAGLSGINLYEPAELVMTLKPGTPMAEVQATLAAQRQRLAFDPPDLGPLLGVDAGGGTIGGAVLTNLAGPGRPRQGAARDHLLGFKGVSGRGEAFKSGGRVVKNVTGFDLSKLMAGSFGTLAALTELSLRVLPIPEKTRTVLLFGAPAADGARAMAAALGSPHDVDAAAFLPAGVAARSAVDYVSGAGESVTALRVEGPGPSVAARCAALRGLLASFGAVEELHTARSETLWRELRDVAPFTGGDGEFADRRQVWRLSTAPSAGPALGQELAEDFDGEWYADWGGGLVWLAIPPRDDAAHHPVRAALAEAGGGHATLMRADAPVRAAVPVFQPQAPALAALGQRVKAGFDPKGILNPGRMDT